MNNKEILNKNINKINNIRNEENVRINLNSNYYKDDSIDKGRTNIIKINNNNDNLDIIKAQINNINLDNNDNHFSINVISDEKDKKKIKTKSSFRNSIHKNKKLIIESKEEFSNNNIHNGKTIFSPIKTKTLFSFSNPKKKKQIKFKKFKNGNILYNMSRIPPIIDKEGLLMEILHANNEIEFLDLELIKAKKKRKKLEQKFLANKLIIEGILDIQDENNIKVNKINNSFETEQFITENKNEKNETENFEKSERNKINNLFNQRTETNYFKSRNNINHNPIIISLKKQINNCDKIIEDKNKLMEIAKNDNRINNFIKINSSIESKNRTLEELNNKSQTLKYIILDIETRIEFFVVKTQNYIDDTSKLNEVLNINNTKIIKNEKDLQTLYLEKEEILKKINLLEEDENLFHLSKENKKKEKEKVKNELKITEDMIKEKNNNEKEIIELNQKEIILRRNIDKNNILINSISNDKKYMDNKIERYLNEREGLIEKSKSPQKSRERSKKLENEIKNIKKEYEENKNYIDNHEKIKEKLNKKINEISEELKNRKIEKKRIEEELNKIKRIYKTEVPKEYRKLNESEIEEEKNINEEKSKNKEKKDCLIF